MYPRRKTDKGKLLANRTVFDRVDDNEALVNFSMGLNFLPPQSTTVMMFAKTIS